MIEKGLEFNLGVAQHIRIRRAACRVLAQKIRKYAIFVFCCEVDGFDIHTDHVRDAGRIEPVLARRTVFGVVIVLPVFHE
jgi:hypothetical protein